MLECNLPHFSFLTYKPLITRHLLENKWWKMAWHGNISPLLKFIYLPASMKLFVWWHFITFFLSQLAVSTYVNECREISRRNLLTSFPCLKDLSSFLCSLGCFSLCPLSEFSSFSSVSHLQNSGFSLTHNNTGKYPLYLKLSYNYVFS